MHYLKTDYRGRRGWSSEKTNIERFFRDISEDVIRDGSFTSVAQLVETMTSYLADRNLNPKRYVWKAKGEEILAKIQRAREAQIQSPIISSQL